MRGRRDQPHRPEHGQRPLIVVRQAGGWHRPLVLEGIEAIMFRTIGDRPSLWESLLPPEVLRLPEELARVNACWMTRRSSRRSRRTSTR